MSDIHVEFFRGGFGRWLAEQARSSAEGSPDVLVLAGDIDVALGLRQTLRQFCDLWPKVVFVPGNHEFYGSSPSEVDQIRAALVREAPNLEWLDTQARVIDGVRFMGTTLWYPRPDPASSAAQRMNDYHKVRGFVPWVYEQNAKARELIRAKAAASDVVVTHHLPTVLAIHPQYAGDPLNHFFCDDHTTQIEAGGPKLWLFGHTHAPIDIHLGQTRLVCNPKGYPGEVPGAYPLRFLEVEARRG